MCQLTIVNLGSNKMNLLADYLLSFGPSKVHNDGYGLMVNGVFDKTEHAPMVLTNFGKFTSDLVGNRRSPVFSHIRQASTGVEVCEDNAHPFESDNFLLMHNGTLVRAGEKRTYAKQDSDSFIFLQQLEEEYGKTKNFVDAFNNSMKQFWGKFAFLIFSKKENVHYICRGTTATLFKIDLFGKPNGESKGYIVNTERDNLVTVRIMLRNINQIINGEDLSFSEPAILDSNSIFKCEGANITKIAETQENEEKDFLPKVAKNAIVNVRNQIESGVQSLFPHSNINRASSHDSNNTVDEIPDEEKNTARYLISQYMIKHWLSPKDIDLMFELYMGVKFLTADLPMINLFAREVLPRIQPSGGQYTLRFLEKNLQGHRLFPHFIYSRFKLEYPWMVNDQQDVIRAVKAYNAENLSRKGDFVN